MPDPPAHELTAALPLVEWVDRQKGRLPLPTGHPRILLGPYADADWMAPGAWLARLGGRERFVESCGPNDVVWVPLHRSLTDMPCWSWEYDKLDDFDEHAAVIREIAPNVRGVMVGNMGPEFAAHRGSGDEFVLQEGGDFLMRAAELVLDAGGVPFVGTVDWTLLMDCAAGGPLQRIIKNVGAVQVCYCGFCLDRAAYWDRGNRFWGGQVAWQLERYGAAPAPEVVAYIEATEWWADVNGLAGLEAGNDRALQGMGFKVACYDPEMVT
ncbi:MAG: hypothetical protein PHZ19_11530 [Candidatus Thermoplasmatota archaeon]|nr:hypothetical protein [Candidatus Thermoplasmatota archaeon]